jgi:hypothetical protein
MSKRNHHDHDDQGDQQRIDDTLDKMQIGESIWLDACTRADQAGICTHDWALVSASMTAKLIKDCAPSKIEGAYLLSRCLSGLLASLAGHAADCENHQGEPFETWANILTSEKPPRKRRRSKRKGGR